MRNVWLALLLVALGTLVGLGGYYMGGRSDALDDVRPLSRLADRLIAKGEGGVGLGRERVLALLQVERADHARDGTAPFTQDLALRLGFEHFESGPARIRLAGYRSALEDRLSQRRMLAVWLETVEMGEGPDGPIRGFYEASRAIYHRPPSRLSDDEFLRLVAVATTSPQYRLDGADPRLDQQVNRLRDLLSRYEDSRPETT